MYYSTLALTAWIYYLEDNDGRPEDIRTYEHAYNRHVEQGAHDWHNDGPPAMAAMVIAGTAPDGRPVLDYRPYGETTAGANASTELNDAISAELYTWRMPETARWCEPDDDHTALLAELARSLETPPLYYSIHPYAVVAHRRPKGKA